MTRVQKIAPENWDAELRTLAAPETATPLEQGLTRILANAPDYAKAVAHFGRGLFGSRTLSRRLIELVRLRIAFHNQCRSCMAIRYQSAIDDGLTEGAVCSLERPHEAADLTEAEKAAVNYAELSSINHLAIGDETFEDLRKHFTEAQIVELGCFIAFFIGFGRLAATWNMIEELPEGYQSKPGTVAPWTEELVVVRG